MSGSVVSNGNNRVFATSSEAFDMAANNKKRKVSNGNDESERIGDMSESLGSNTDSHKADSPNKSRDGNEGDRNSGVPKQEERSEDGASPAKRSFKAPLMSDLLGSSLNLSIDTTVTHTPAPPPSFPIPNYSIHPPGFVVDPKLSQVIIPQGSHPQGGYVYSPHALPFSAAGSSAVSAPPGQHGPYFVGTAGPSSALIYHPGPGATAGGVNAAAAAAAAMASHYSFPAGAYSGVLGIPHHPQPMPHHPHQTAAVAATSAPAPKYIRDSNGVIYQAISTSNGLPLANVVSGHHLPFQGYPSSATAAPAPTAVGGGYSFPLATGTGTGAPPPGKSSSAPTLAVATATTTTGAAGGKRNDVTAVTPAAGAASAALSFYPPLNAATANHLQQALNNSHASTAAAAAAAATPVPDVHGMKPASTSELLGAAAYPKGYVLPMVTTTYVKDANGIVSPRNFVVDANAEPYFVKDENGNITPRGLPLTSDMILNNSLIIPKTYGAPDSSPVVSHHYTTATAATAAAGHHGVPLTNGQLFGGVPLTSVAPSGQPEYKTVAFAAPGLQQSFNAASSAAATTAAAASSYPSYSKHDNPAFTPRSYIRTIADLAGDIMPVKPTMTRSSSSGSGSGGVTNAVYAGSSQTSSSASATNISSSSNGASSSSIDIAGDMSPRSAAYALVSFGQMQFAPQSTSSSSLLPIGGSSSSVSAYSGSSVASEVSVKSEPDIHFVSGYSGVVNTSNVGSSAGNNGTPYRQPAAISNSAPVALAVAAGKNSSVNSASAAFQSLLYSQYCEEVVLPTCKESGCNVRVEASNMQYCLDHRPSRRCKAEGCTKCAQGATDFCISHGGGRRCTFPGCTKGARDKQFCAGHGGGRRCTQPGCTKSAVGKSDHCTAHGGGKRCGFPGCDKSSQSTTKFCVKHGGGKCCARPNCTKVARGKTDYCASHGGGIRCVSGGCLKLAIGPQKLCRLHTVQMKRSNTSGYSPAQLQQLQQQQQAAYRNSMNNNQQQGYSQGLDVLPPFEEQEGEDGDDDLDELAADDEDFGGDLEGIKA